MPWDGLQELGIDQKLHFPGLQTGTPGGIVGGAEVQSGLVQPLFITFPGPGHRGLVALPLLVTRGADLKVNQAALIDRKRGGNQGTTPAQVGDIDKDKPPGATTPLLHNAPTFAIVDNADQRGIERLPFQASSFLCGSHWSSLRVWRNFSRFFLNCCMIRYKGHLVSIPCVVMAAVSL